MREHEHEHDHEHEQEHHHGHAHEHGHEHHHDHASGATPMEELVAMLRYMAGHNDAHTRELAELAGQLDTAGKHGQYEQVMRAVEEYRQANARLQGVLEKLE